MIEFHIDKFGVYLQQLEAVTPGYGKRLVRQLAYQWPFWVHKNPHIKPGFCCVFRALKNNQ